MKFDTPVHELYPAIQAEGSRAGRPTIIVRTTGCTHRCFVDIPGRKHAVVYLASGTPTKLKNVKPGDMIMAWDELNQTISPTTVNSIEVNKVQDYVIVEFVDHKHLCVTPEHPFLTTRGWKMACDLSETDELVHISGRARNSWRMKTANPMYNSSIVEKAQSHPNYKNFGNYPLQLHNTHLSRLKKYGTLQPSATMSESAKIEMKQRASIRMKQDNPMYDVDIVASAIKTRVENGGGLGWHMGVEMSAYELDFWNLILKHNLQDEIWFTGNGKFTLKCSGKLKVPDFKVHNSNKFIEVGVPTWFRPDWDAYEKELFEIYSKSSLPDTQYLAINMNWPEDEIISKVKTFLTNGIKIKKIKHIHSKNSYTTYNLHCNEHHNYLVEVGHCESVVSHNCYFGEGGWCDAWQSSIHPEKACYNFSDIIDMYDQYPHIKEMMLTGGSPTMHSDFVNKITQFCAVKGIFLTMETEGSHFIKTEYPIDLISLSPKFSNSVPKLGIKTPQGKDVDYKFIEQHNKYRLNYEAIFKLLDYHKDYHYKPVWGGDVQTLGEIEEFRVICNIPKEKTFLMPAGDNRETLFETYKITMEKCIQMGYNWTGRPHIIAFDKQRYV